MEGEIARVRIPGRLAIACMAGAVILQPPAAVAQQPPPSTISQEPAQITMRKFIKTREFQGRAIQGEERIVAAGDSLWRILIQERKLSEKKFQSYITIIRGLNPQLKSVDTLRVGEPIFIPLRPDAIMESDMGSVKEEARPRVPPAAGTSVSYRVKAGEHLFQILGEQLRIQDKKQMAEYFAIVKTLNTEKKNWDLLQVGEIIRLPVIEKARGTVVSEVEPGPKAESPVGSPLAAPPKEKPVLPTLALDHDPRRIPAREHLALLGKILETLGCELQRAGEEVIALTDGTIRIDKSLYPVAYNPKLRQKVVVDPEDSIPASLRAKLADPSVATPVLPIPRGASLQETVSRLLLGMGYQLLPTGRPVVIQDGGVAFEANGNWMVLTPEESNKPQEIYAINLTDSLLKIPEYLLSRLAVKGLYWKDVQLPPPEADVAAVAAAKGENYSMQVRMWPRDKQAVVDALLLTYGIPFGVSEKLSINLRDGLSVDAHSDRIFQLGDQRTALFFQRAEPEIRKVLQEKQGLKTIELEVASLSSREIIGKLLNELGEKAAYKEHRFQAVPGGVGDKLVVTTSGFLALQRSLFVTDREIPASLQRFFFERGWEIVYFE
jgi:hypothetical protein